MAQETSFTCEHHKYGIGTAILIKHRKDQRLDLFMCSFKGLGKQRTFYCRKHFELEEEIWWSDGTPRKRVKIPTKSDELEEQLKSFFFGGNPINS
jgi:hypothetical protein